jgi:hypothetical protein
MADAGPSSDPLGERLRDDRLIEDAMARAIRDALRRHKQAGNPVATWRDGRVVWIPAEEIQVPDE